MTTQAKRKYLVNRDLFSNYYLENLLTESSEWRDINEEELEDVYREIKELYDSKKKYVEGYKEGQLEDNFIRPIFKILDLTYEVQEKVSRSTRFPDYCIFKSQDDADRANEHKGEKDFYIHAVTIAEAKRWGQSLDKMDKSGNVRDFSNPSHQVFVYQQETEVDWAVLTTGQKWRLYHYKTSDKLDSYYEIDLSTILEMDVEESYEAFKYFYLFFRVEAFVKSVRGTCFLDRIYEKSNIFSQELEDDLKENIYEAIKQLAQGFLKHPENKLDPRKDIKLIHDSSLVYLYRLIFVLYAESEGRNLLDTNNRIYNGDYSMNSLKKEVCDKSEEDYTDWQTKIWDRLQKLFELIDGGSKSKSIPENELYIPAYNGGLFRTVVTEDAEKEIEFLQMYKVGDTYLARVINLLTRHESKNGKGRVFVDYSSLNIRHLGSIYEGLLEYRLNIATEDMVAVKEKKEQKWYAKSEYEGDGNIIEEIDGGDIYLTTDKGERKATGSYYTPEYIVQYIVENTLGPILKGIKDGLLRESGGNFANEFAERVFQLKVLDPAMGSGHFLTNTIDYLAREIIDARDKQAEEHGIETIDESHDIHWARRQVAQRCIYGVDLNPMAVELAKVSLWLRTLASKQPLAFLDHHLKTGNSLIGSDIEDIDELSSSSKKGAENTATLEDFGMAWKGTMEDLMKIYQDFIKIENQELADIKEMEEKFHEFEHEPIRERLDAMANVHTAQDFGVDVPKDAFARMAKAIKDGKKWKNIESEGWFEESQEVANEENFFHWKLEFPEVFYDEKGGTMEKEAGFDVVIGNPPYFNLETTKGTLFNDYLRNEYEDIFSGKADVLYFFIDKGGVLFKEGGALSYIVSRYFTEAHNAKDFRNKLSETRHINKMVDFGNNQIFPKVDTLTIILKIDKDRSNNETAVIQVSDNLNSDSDAIRQSLKDIEEKAETSVATKYTVPSNTFGRKRWLLLPKSVLCIKEKMQSHGTMLGDFCQTGQGMMTGLNEAFTVTESDIKKWNIEKDVLKPLVKNGDLRSYLYKGNDMKLIYLENKDISDFPSTEKYLDQFHDALLERAKANDIKWYRYQNPINKDLFENLEEKIICPFIATNNRFYLDKIRLYNDGGDIEIITQIDKLLSNESLVAICNSRLLEFFHLNHAKLKRDGYYEYFGNSLKDLPIYTKTKPINELFKKKIEKSSTENSDTSHDALTELSDRIANLKEKHNKVNINLSDYLGNYSYEKTLEDVYYPLERVSETILTDTTVERDKLRIGGIEFLENDSELMLKVSARYKPESEEEFINLDRWGYTETDLIPAMKFTGSEIELALIREFTKLAVVEGRGFANFRGEATKTMSILDRLEKLTLPKLSDVENGLKKYLEQKEKAEQLEEEIKEIDHTIDAIVFGLYELTEEEVETVLDSLDTSEEDKANILAKFRELKE